MSVTVIPCHFTWIQSHDYPKGNINNKSLDLTSVNYELSSSQQKVLTYRNFADQMQKHYWKTRTEKLKNYHNMVLGACVSLVFLSNFLSKFVAGEIETITEECSENSVIMYDDDCDGRPAKYVKGCSYVYIELQIDSDEGICSTTEIFSTNAPNNYMEMIAKNTNDGEFDDEDIEEIIVLCDFQDVCNLTSYDNCGNVVAFCYGRCNYDCVARGQCIQGVGAVKY